MNPKARSDRAAVWQYAVRHDPRLSDLARTIALDALVSPTWPVLLSAAAMAAKHGTDEAAVWRAVDELLDGPRYVRLFPDGAVFVNILRDNVWRYADHLARQNRTTLRSVIREHRQHLAPRAAA